MAVPDVCLSFTFLLCNLRYCEKCINIGRLRIFLVEIPDFMCTLTLHNTIHGDCTKTLSILYDHIVDNGESLGSEAIFIYH